jgi:WhiB family redox-sensing transcriptional regulator
MTITSSVEAEVLAGLAAPGDYDIPWQQSGECRRQVKEGIRDVKEIMRLFYPTRHSTPADILVAKGMCEVCPVRDECHDWAHETREPNGIFGGETQEERRLQRSAARRAYKGKD